MLGTAVFATAAAVGLLAVRAFAQPGNWPSLLTRLSPATALAGLSILAAGLTVMRGAGGKELGASRLAGTCVALLGGVVMLAALALAWPWPGWTLAVGAFDAAALAWAGFRWRLPPLPPRPSLASRLSISPPSTLPPAILRRRTGGTHLAFPGSSTPVLLKCWTWGRWVVTECPECRCTPDRPCTIALEDDCGEAACVPPGAYGLPACSKCYQGTT